MNVEPSEQARWFAREVQPHESALRSWLHGRFPAMSDVDDIVQESYVRLLRAKGEGKVGYAKAYLFSTARNFALDLFRRSKVVKMEPATDLGAVVEDRPSVAETVSRQQELDMLADSIRLLPNRCRQVLTLRLLYGLSHKEIAAELQISEHTVKAQIAKGMRRCSEYFRDRGCGPLMVKDSAHDTAPRQQAD